MDRRQFFDQLHTSLGSKYSISPGLINSIRSFHFNQGMSREDIMDWADEKIRFARRNNNLPKKNYILLFNFLEELSDEAWEDITQKTKFDN